MPKSLTPLQVATASSDNQQATLGIIIAESLGMGGMFIMTLKASWRKFLEMHLRKFLFPLAVLCDITCTCLVWHMVYLKPQNKNLLTRAIIETIGVLVEVAAILMVIFAASVAGMVTPLLLTVATGAKAVVNTGLGFFYAIKAAFMTDSEQKNTYKMLALECSVQAVCGAFITLATAGALLAGKIGFAIFGIAAALIAVSVCTYKWATMPKPKDTLPITPDTLPTEESPTDLSENAKMAKSLGVEPSQKPEEKVTIANDFVMPKSNALASNNLRFFPDFDLIDFSDNNQPSDTPDNQPSNTSDDVIYVKRTVGG